jgi:RimJ/RimL family protein N-acetyltransferase
MFIRSERLFLRPGWPEDWREIFSQIADEGVVRNLAQVPWPYTVEAARQFAELGQDPRCPHFLMTLPGAEGARVIGCIGLAPDPDGVELGYWLGRPYWNRGFATEAARAVLGLARMLGHRRLFAGHFLDNPASGRVLRKAGFRPTGRIEQRYSLARGVLAPAARHTITLDPAGDCDGDDDEARAMRAA